MFDGPRPWPTRAEQMTAKSESSGIREDIQSGSSTDAGGQHVSAGSDEQALSQLHFPICGKRRFNCIVDGDTFWYNGEKIRVADIDTPEVGRPKCSRERALGIQATIRFQELLNAGPFVLHRGDRDRDRYGRKLRYVLRDGASLGDHLVQEGLARRWQGRRESWC